MKLSNCAKAKARSVPGFPQQPRIASSTAATQVRSRDANPSRVKSRRELKHLEFFSWFEYFQGDDAPLVEHEDEAQIYRTLEELVNEDNYKEFYYQVSSPTISKSIIN